MRPRPSTAARREGHGSVVDATHLVALFSRATRASGGPPRRNAVVMPRPCLPLSRTHGLSGHGRGEPAAGVPPPDRATLRPPGAHLLEERRQPSCPLAPRRAGGAFDRGGRVTGTHQLRGTRRGERAHQPRRERVLPQHRLVRRHLRPRHPDRRFLQVHGRPSLARVAGLAHAYSSSGAISSTAPTTASVPPSRGQPRSAHRRRREALHHRRPRLPLIVINSVVTLIGFLGVLWGISPALVGCFSSMPAVGTAVSVLFGRPAGGPLFQPVSEEADFPVRPGARARQRGIDRLLSRRKARAARPHRAPQRRARNSLPDHRAGPGTCRSSRTPTITSR